MTRKQWIPLSAIVGAALWMAAILNPGNIPLAIIGGIGFIWACTAGEFK